MRPTVERPTRLRALGRALVAGLLLVTTAAACSKDDDARAAVEAFLSGWRAGKLDDVGLIEPAGSKIAASDVVQQIKALSGELAETPPSLKIAGSSTKARNIERFPVAVDWTLPGGAHWAYQTEVQASEGDDGWRVIWEPSLMQEKLTEGDKLVIRRKTAPRASILDAAGQPIVQKRPVVIVGVVPSEITDIKALVKELKAAFDSIHASVDLADLPARVKNAKANEFVDVVPLRKPDYLKIKPRIHPLDGTKFVDEQRDLAPSREFARALLGTVDPVLKEDMDAKPGVYEVGDTAGHGGLQGRYEDRLRGTLGQQVLISRKSADETVELIEVYQVPPQPGAPLKTTLDQKVQNAADQALAGDKKHRTAIVAIRVSDGAVLAVANGPDGGAENLAFTAQVPPGSTFKMVATLGLLDAGAVTLDGPVDCPKEFPVEGRTFTNAHNFELGKRPFRVDFAKSCNTAFASLAPKLGPNGLATAGGSLGVGGTWDLGVDGFTGKVSTGGSGVERAAATFGQGTTVVSPLAMAGATAAVVRGQWQQPKLLLDPAPATVAPAGPQLKETSVVPLRTMMREVVTGGTGKALSDVPGGPVYGKTGTAEFNDNKEDAHGWFVGWQGDMAFAVFVERGGDSTASSVPLTERFLRKLHEAG